MPPRQKALLHLSRYHGLWLLLLGALLAFKQRLCGRLSGLHQLQRR
jgi:hypothetical protein